MIKKSLQQPPTENRSANYTVAGQSITTSIENRVRKEIRLTLPDYTQTFDVTTIIDVPHLRSHVLGQPYRIYCSQGKLISEGIMSEVSGIVRTKSRMPVRCEIGGGNWSVAQEGYDYADVEKLLLDEPHLSVNNGAMKT